MPSEGFSGVLVAVAAEADSAGLVCLWRVGGLLLMGDEEEAEGVTLAAKR